jgi:hypothetical protein
MSTPALETAPSVETNQDDRDGNEREKKARPATISPQTDTTDPARDREMNIATTQTSVASHRSSDLAENAPRRNGARPFGSGRAPRNLISYRVSNIHNRAAFQNKWRRYSGCKTLR